MEEDEPTAESDFEEEEEMDRLQEMEIEQVESIYMPLDSIPGISNSVMEQIVWHDRFFIHQMAQDEYLLGMVKTMFENARKHVAVELQPHEYSTIKTVVRALKQRTDYFSELAKEVKRNSFSLEILETARGKTQAFMLMLEPFVLTEDEMGREDLLLTHFQDISLLYIRAENAFAKIVTAIYSEEDKKKEYVSMEQTPKIDNTRLENSERGGSRRSLDRGRRK